MPPKAKAAAKSVSMAVAKAAPLAVVKAVAKAGPKAAAKVAARPKTAVALEHVIWVKTSYDRLKAQYVPGADRVLESVKAGNADFSPKRDAVTNILKLLKAGMSPAEIMALWKGARARGNRAYP